MIDKISMLSLKMFATIYQQLQLAKRLAQNSTAVFGGLSLVLLLGNLYQFAPIQGHALWENAHTKIEKHGKHL